MNAVSKRKKYGQFDFLKRALTEYELLEAPPRDIYEILCSRFGFKKRQINMNSLGSWLRRTRKKVKEKKIAIPPNAGNWGLKNLKASEKVNDRFMSFQPTDPMEELTNKNIKTTLLKRPLYKK